MGGVVRVVCQGFLDLGKQPGGDAVRWVIRDGAEDKYG